MRICIDGNGNDTTDVMRSFCMSRRGVIQQADLIQLKTAVQGEPWSKVLNLTPHARPLTWNRQGTFIPKGIKRQTIESVIGLDTQSCTVEFDLSDRDLFGPITLLQSFVAGLWDQGEAHIWRTVMPAEGDCNTLGAYELFGGFIADTRPTLQGVQITINSLTERFDQKIPTNLIKAGNPKAEYGLGSAPAGCSSVPVFTVLAGSTPSRLLASCVSPTAGQVFTAEVFNVGYIQFQSGASLGKMFATIRRSEGFSGTNLFRLYEPLPWNPQPGDQFSAFVPSARSQSSTVTETHVIPASDPYSVTISNHATYAAVVSINYDNGTSVPSYMTDGAGGFVFPAADAGKTVRITYTYHNGNESQGFPYVPVPEATI
jgi:Uncharacterized conserved protein (DUF2163)